MKITITETREMTFELPDGVEVPVASTMDPPYEGQFTPERVCEWLEGVGKTLDAKWSAPAKTYTWRAR